MKVLSLLATDKDGHDNWAVLRHRILGEKNTTSSVWSVAAVNHRDGGK